MRHSQPLGIRAGQSAGLVWACASRQTRAVAALAVGAAATLVFLFLAAVPDGQAAQASVIVRTSPQSGPTLEQKVRALGGSIDRRFSSMGTFVATLPAGRVASLRTTPGVVSVTPDRRVQLAGTDPTTWNPKEDLGSMVYVAQEVTGAGEYWNDGFTGRGVDVAVIDSGIAPVNGLSGEGKVVHGPDLSFESQDPLLRYLDTNGHGTHMAGIIAGREDGVPARVQKGEERFVGIAPDARIVSLKVADARGSTDVSQVLAAIDWVVQHRQSNGLNIRVLNLSFGTDSEQDYRVDPLAYAAEVAWRNGIVVVVAAGNGGYGSSGLNSPAYDPFVLAVGGADGNGTYGWKDDIVPSWSSWGTPRRRPDLVAPGKSIVSLRTPGSYLDLAYPSGRVADRFFRGSGTSQAAAVASGAAALVIQQRPGITPDGVKALLIASAQKLLHAKKDGQGAGMLNLKLARDMSTPKSKQSFEPATGSGSLALARGSSQLEWDGTVLDGERDIFGMPFVAADWAPQSGAGTTWSDGFWNGSAWAGNAWSGNVWSTTLWSGNAWSGNAWSGNAWSGNAWSGNAWSGNVWSGNAWSGNAWSGNAWSGNAWSGNAWSAAGWGTSADAAPPRG